MAQTAVDNLNTFYVVGVVEQYKGFIEVLKRSLDPTEEHPELWQAAVRVKDNGYAVSKPLVSRLLSCRTMQSTPLGFGGAGNGTQTATGAWSTKKALLGQTGFFLMCPFVLALLILFCRVLRISDLPSCADVAINLVCAVRGMRMDAHTASLPGQITSNPSL